MTPALIDQAVTYIARKYSIDAETMVLRTALEHLVCAERAEGKAEGFREGVEASANRVQELKHRWTGRAMRCDTDGCDDAAREYRCEAAALEVVECELRSALVVTPAASDSAQAEREKTPVTARRVRREIVLEDDAEERMPIPTYEEGQVAAKRLGIDVDAWAKDVKQRVDERDQDKGHADALDLDELDQILTEATKGPWRRAEPLIVREFTAERCRYICEMAGTREDHDADAQAIVALHNAAPELIRRARERDDILSSHALTDAKLFAAEDRAEKAERERDAMQPLLDWAEDYKRTSTLDIERLTAERDELRDALQQIVDLINEGPLHVNDDLDAIARAALNKVQP